MTRVYTFLQNRWVEILFLSLVSYLCFPVSLFSDAYRCLGPLGENEPCYQGYLLQEIDPSWKTAVGLAIANSLSFGREFIFTYGPLGFLSTRVSVGINPIFLVASDLFVIANIVFIVWCVRKKFRGAWPMVLCLVFCYLFPQQDITYKLLLIMLFWMILGLENGLAAYFIVPAIIAVLSFFIKFNTSFLALFLLYLFLSGSMVLQKRLEISKLLLAAAVPALILFAGYVFNVDIKGYISTGFELINGYSEAMNVLNANMAKYIAGILLISSATIIVLAYRLVTTRGDIATILSFFGFVPLIFILFKHSVTRMDAPHLFAPFYWIPAIWAMCAYFYSRSPRMNYLVFAASMLSLLIGAHLLRLAEPFETFDPTRKFNYVVGIVGHGTYQARANNPIPELPPKIMDAIGINTVDIIPWDVNLIYFNGLRYDPRPAIQSYLAYSEVLIKLNREKYEGLDAPEFVILSDETIDGRYGFFDDMGLKLALLENYRVREKFKLSEHSYLLLQRRSVRQSLSFGAPRAYSMDLYQNFDIPDTDKMYYARLNLDYSALGYMARLVFQPLRLKIVFSLSDGSERAFRLIRPIAKSGVVINPFVETTDDYDLFYEGLNGGLRKVKSFRIEPTEQRKLRSAAELMYTRPFLVELWEMKISP